MNIFKANHITDETRINCWVVHFLVGGRLHFACVPFKLYKASDFSAIDRMHVPFKIYG